MATKSLDLWQLVRGRPEIDPNDLTEAIVAQLETDAADYRTRLLIRDSVEALRLFWGESRVNRWLDSMKQGASVREICGEVYEEVGFPSLRRRIMEKTTQETIVAYFRDLGYELRTKTQIFVAGACALILPNYVTRSTEDIGVVGDIPEEIRKRHAVLDRRESTYHLHLGHVQTHYFPKGWSERVHSFGVYNFLQVSLVDVYNVFLSKLFSKRVKDAQDLRVLLPQLEKATLAQRFRTTCPDFLVIDNLRETAERNWHILFGESLPS